MTESPFRDREREDSNSYRVALSLAGIAIEIGLSADATYYFSLLSRYFPASSPQQAAAVSAAAGNGYGAIGLLLIAAIFPLVYCTVIGSQTKPKLTVNPVVIMLGALLGDTLLSADYLIRAPSVSGLIPSPLALQWSEFGGLTIVFFFFAAMLGAFSLVGVRLIIGSSLVGLDSITYRFNLPASIISKTFNSNSILTNLKFWKQVEADSGVVVLRRRWRTLDEVVLAIGPDPDEPETRGILATVAYRRNQYGLAPSKGASDTRDSIVLDIEGRCRDRYTIASKTKLDEAMDYVSVRARAVAAAPTESKVGSIIDSFRDLDRPFQYIIGATLLGFLAFPIASGLRIFPNFDLGSTLALLFITLVVEVGLALRTELLQKKKQNPIWWSPSS